MCMHHMNPDMHSSSAGSDKCMELEDKFEGLQSVLHTEWGLVWSVTPNPARAYVTGAGGQYPICGQASGADCLLLAQRCMQASVCLPEGWEITAVGGAPQLTKCPWPNCSHSNYLLAASSISFSKPQLKLQLMGVTMAKLLVKDVMHGIVRESLVQVCIPASGLCQVYNSAACSWAAALPLTASSAVCWGCVEMGEGCAFHRAQCACSRRGQAHCMFLADCEWYCRI